jgi:hypothetical protein
MNVRLIVLLVWLSSNLDAQAVIEAAAGAARATTTVAPAQKVGNSINGAFDKLNRALQNAEKAKPASPRAATSSTSSPVSAAVKPASVTTPSMPKSDVALEDPSGIHEGMDYVEVTKRFGPPSLELTTGPDQETLCYIQKGISIDVTVRNGKVTAVQKTGGRDSATELPSK